MEAIAISGTRRAMKEMADGTIRVQIDIDPACKRAFQDLFPDIDTPVALAPLRADFERKAADGQEKPKGGDLARLAGQLCQSPEFQRWCGVESADAAAEFIRKTCGVDSRADLDHDLEAAARFHERVRKEFLARKVAA
uniref:hypothetical protein n=1 Tax=Castellaniella defragrans TaxID=75697 RepID=UPI0033409891